MGLACVWLLLLFRERDVPGSFYWYYPYKGVDIERCLDGNDECLTGLSFDFRTCRIPKDGLQGAAIASVIAEAVSFSFSWFTRDLP